MGTHSYDIAMLDYASLRSQRTDNVREERESIREEAVQSCWYQQQGLPKTLRTVQGQRLRVLSPGWWNRGEGPDFIGAQLQFNGRLKTGDVEVHLRHDDWRAHGHDADLRYDEVMLHVVLDDKPPSTPIRTVTGRSVPTLLLANFLTAGVPTRVDADAPASPPVPAAGRCGAWSRQHDSQSLKQLIELAGEWRLLFKARALSDRIDCVGPDQAVYELLMQACGYSQYKQEFLALARHVPYDRARQLAREDPHLLEAALLQVAGLLPGDLPYDAPGRTHWERLMQLRGERLAGLRPIAMTWNRAAVRPTNLPERRISGIARLIARTATDGLLPNLDAIWREDISPAARRALFERLFPRAFGFWANHCTWSGKPLRAANAPLGAGRVRSIIGNVFLPAGIAAARRQRNRNMEASVLALFARLPQEQGNHVVRLMLPRLFGAAKPPRMTFRLQQGLIQMFLDWCEPNPACLNCAVAHRLEQIERLDTNVAGTDKTT